MIKLVLLTGFLGAGKTTLMKELLDIYGKDKIGVIINEFGETNIDAMLIDRVGIRMSELSNGSIFCSCIKDKFVDSLIEMSYFDLDYVFIEASGLADPANMDKIIEGLRNKLKNQYNYIGSVCIVDGESFINLYEVLPAIRSQLEFCGSTIINKGDLVDDKQLEETINIIGNINTYSEIVVTSYCKVDIKGIVDNLKKPKTSDRETSNTYETRPTTFILKGTDIIPYEKLDIFLHEIAMSSYRIKGFADTDKGIKSISSVGKNIYINEWSRNIKNTEIVVISSVGFRMISVLTRALKNSGLKEYLKI